QFIPEDARKEKRFPARIADDAVFLRIGFHCANRRPPDQARVTRKVYADRGRDRNTRSGIRTGAKPNNDSFRSAKFSSSGLEILEKRCRIFSVVRPFARELDFAVQPRQAAARGGEFKRENFHSCD